MATRKRLGAVSPAAATETDLYNSPSSVSDVVISSIVVCNRGSAATTFRVSASPEASSTANADYLFYDTPIAAKETMVIQIGLTIEPDWDVRVYAGTANLSFSAFGQEN